MGFASELPSSLNPSPNDGNLPGPPPAVRQVAHEFQHYASAYSYNSGETNEEEDSLETIETRKPTAEMPDDRIGVS